MTTTSSLLELRGITKRFGQLVADDHVDLQVTEGEIHALVGENGAGKTTLMNMVFGLVHPDEGEILLRGAPVTIRSPLAAARHGIGMVHQHFKLVPSLSAAENIFLGREPGSGPMLHGPQAIRQAAELAERYGLTIDPAARVRFLSVGQQQRVEILKALSYDAQLLILDEPTAVLTPQETEELIQVVHELRTRGKTVIFITHKLNEVRAVADRFSVMRDGKRIATVETGEATEADIARMMVGREVLFRVTKPDVVPGRTLLEVTGLSGLRVDGTEAVRNVSLGVCAGEIVGVAGVEGNGQSELAEFICGLRPPTAGRIAIDGREVTRANVVEHRRAGLAFVAEDRMDRGVSGAMSVSENLAGTHYSDPGIAPHGIVSPGRLRRWARGLIRRFDIRNATPATPVQALSGGNIQKVVLARELSTEPKVLLAAQPSRGLDVGATESVHRTLIEQRSQGRAILLISSELSEVLSLSDRILVMYGGRVVHETPASAATDEGLGLYMMGLRSDEAGEAA
ncbi:MAG: ABC transporter ATP-binding protein [Chloroflexi bacterium]|nr:ABC transporter ATP-binding protein [Chloroflexota bacterium]